MTLAVTDERKSAKRAKVARLLTRARSSAKMTASKAEVTGKFRDVYTASPEDRIKMIRRGMPATEAKRLVQVLGVEQKAFYHALGLKTATVNRKIAQSEQLSTDESERLLGVAKLIGQVETIVAEAGDPQGFSAPEWISRWLREPLPALGGTAPIDLLDTMEGQAMVAEALARIHSGAYA
ncbi:MAG: hypothetical protein C0491_07045 [Novosphingobium sp.]|nr:hypothetical protein [Novosphingobium sp.]